METSKNTYPPIGIYEHYKSTPTNRKYYQVIGFARHTETEEILVIYVPLYTDAQHTGPRLQARPLSMFMQQVNNNTPRFAYIGVEL